jgi:SprT-like family
MKQYSNREEWLVAGVEELRPVFGAINKALPEKIRVACGFPLDAKRSRAIGQCWSDTASADRTVEILISPELADPVEVFEVLVHELCHATHGAMNHGKKFIDVASKMLLCAVGSGKQPWKSTKGNDQFIGAYGEMIKSLGDYPHAPLKYSTRKTQGTRMLKACCPTCGYTVRLTQKWADQGLPTCICGDVLAI